MTADDELNFSIRPTGEDNTGTGSLRLCLRGRVDIESITSDRLARAVEWALDIDAQYRDLIRAGRSPQVDIPATVLVAAGRVQSETITDYRELRLSVGALIRPLLLDTPKLEQLYPFQHQGVEWLINRSGGILADDMGLGKTVQVVSAMRLLFNRAKLRTTLVICPKGLIATWEREFSRWAPELGVAVTNPSSASSRGCLENGGWTAACVIDQLRTAPHASRNLATDAAGFNRHGRSSPTSQTWITSDFGGF